MVGKRGFVMTRGDEVILEAFNESNAKLASISTYIESFSDDGRLELYTDDPKASVIFFENSDRAISVKELDNAVTAVSLKWTEFEYASLVLFRKEIGTHEFEPDEEDCRQTVTNLKELNMALKESRVSRIGNIRIIMKKVS